MRDKRYKRRQFIVDKGFQYGLIRKFAIVAIFIVTGSLSCLVLVYYNYGDVQVDIVQPAPFGAIDNITEDGTVTTHTLLDLLWPVLSICLVETIIFTFIFSIIISYRMAGPVYRMRQVLKKMAQGDVSGPVSNLRDKDEFKQLFADINKVKEHWRVRIQELQQACQIIGEDKIQKQDLKQINDIVFSFKTETGSGYLEIKKNNPERRRIECDASLSGDEV